MAFWIVALGLGLLVCALFVLAMQRGKVLPETDQFASDTTIYRDQLLELDQDLARGTISEAEAKQARIEISRRLLTADSAANARKGAAGSLAEPAFALYGAVILALLAGSGALYLYLGSPGYPDLPLEGRIEAANDLRQNRPDQATAEAQVTPVQNEFSAEYETLVEQLRQAVSDRPDDLQGHILLAQSETRLGNYIAAHQAQARVLQLKADTATTDDWANYADLLILAAGGYVSPEAEQALTRALALNPKNGLARYYSGLMFLQNARPDLGFQFWSTLLEDSLLSDPWHDLIRNQIEDVAMLAGIRYELPAVSDQPRGPSADDITAAEEMTPEDRAQLIRNMVEGLSERLATDGGSAEEWARLINALAVLGETDRARVILAEAVTVFAEDSTSLALIQRAATEAGLTE